MSQQPIQRAGSGRIPPPVETRFKPGQSGNPKGRPSAGASVREWMNVMQEYRKPEIRRIAHDDDEPVNKRLAAVCWIDSLMPNGDMAEFEPFLDGKMTLAELREKGIDTRAIKKSSVRRNTDKDGNTSEHVTIELRPNGGVDADRLFDRTEGKPTQRLEVQQAEADPTQVLSNIAALLARRPDLAQRVAGVLPLDVVADVVPDHAETQVE